MERIFPMEIGRFEGIRIIESPRRTFVLRAPRSIMPRPTVPQLGALAIGSPPGELSMLARSIRAAFGEAV